MQPKLILEITSSGNMVVGRPDHTVGWGDKAQALFLEGEIADIKIHKDGKSQIGIRILEDGNLIITDYAGLGYETMLDRNFRMRPNRPWKTNE